jgi:hypothetical protein
MFTSVLILKPSKKEIKSESNYWKLFPSVEMRVKLP